MYPVDIFYSLFDNTNNVTIGLLIDRSNISLVIFILYTISSIARSENSIGFVYNQGHDEKEERKRFLRLLWNILKQ
jgi:hypothetical protein